ncbi:MAG: hypothetical protein V4755_17975, partial [Curtobacterium sp.]
MPRRLARWSFLTRRNGSAVSDMGEASSENSALFWAKLASWCWPRRGILRPNSHGSEEQVE